MLWNAILPSALLKGSTRFTLSTLLLCSAALPGCTKASNDVRCEQGDADACFAFARQLEAQGNDGILTQSFYQFGCGLGHADSCDAADRLAQRYHDAEAPKIEDQETRCAAGDGNACTNRAAGARDGYKQPRNAELAFEY